MKDMVYPKKMQQRSFGRFFRGSEVQQEDGVGIGLYLTREILSKEDGYIKVVPNKKRKGGELILYLRKMVVLKLSAVPGENPWDV